MVNNTVHGKQWMKKTKKNNLQNKQMQIKIF